MVSAEERAALDFEPWDRLEVKPPTNEEWACLANPYLVMIRLAWIFVQKTKSELVGIILEIFSSEDAPDAGHQMMESFRSTIIFFEVNLQILKSAEARLLCAAAVAELRTRP